MDKTRLAEKRYRDELKNIKESLDWMKKALKKFERLEKMKETKRKYNHQIRKTKKTTKLQKKKEYELKKEEIWLENKLNKVRW